MEKRGSLGRDLSAPFTDSKNLNPGPGTYGEKRTSFTYKARKKLTTEKIGFDSSDKRPCLKKDEPEEEKIGLVEGQKYEEGEMPNTIASRLTSKMFLVDGFEGYFDRRIPSGVGLVVNGRCDLHLSTKRESPRLVYAAYTAVILVGKVAPSLPKSQIWKSLP